MLSGALHDEAEFVEPEHVVAGCQVLAQLLRFSLAERAIERPIKLD
ncbi:hypothetical protein HGO38_15785 [Rhizobium sp. CG5]|nr:hypothetical protein [Rhizobium sp. CG5]MCM2474942.1 hypothetical protein [Rhizobium sp. CG5]